MTLDYRESHIQPGKGKTYHSTFSNSLYRKMVWELEKGMLDCILRKFYRNTVIQHLDFACGTGRILAYLEDRTTCSVGVDLSESMLEIARENIGNSETIEADLTQCDVLRERKFNLITAFRFFPNAQKQLRIDAMRILSKHLKSDGYIVFNNHMHTGSTRNRLAKFLGHGGYRGMSLPEIKELLSRTGLEIIEVYHLCVFPGSESRKLLPIVLLKQIESILSKFRYCQGYAENLIFVCRHSKAQTHNARLAQLL
jgi:predicted TPR repeat methyltransferase